VYCDRTYTKWQFMFHCICCSHMPHFRPLMLYISKNYLFVLTSAKLRIISQTTKYFTNFF
jgi:hypothetical protein